MRLYVIFFNALFFISFSLLGNSVPLEIAQKVARNFFKTRVGNTSSRIPRTPGLSYTGIDSDGTALFYVFEAVPYTGFVIVSASDNTAPIIGYSTESNFATGFSKTGLNTWLNRWCDEIRYCESTNYRNNSRDSMLWSNYVQGIAPASAKSLGVGP